MDIEKIKLIASLTVAKVEILKMMADGEGFWQYVDKFTKEELEESYKEICKMIEDIKKDTKQ